MYIPLPMSLKTTTSPCVFNTSYGSNNPTTPITSTEIDRMRERLLQNISDLNGNKYRLMPDEYHQLLNYHTYALNILNNRKIIQLAQLSNPYNQNYGLVQQPHSRIETVNPFESPMTVVYKPNGQAKIIDPQNPDNRYAGQWAQQFDLMVYNPPAYTIPPSNVWGLPQRRDNQQIVTRS